MRAVILSIGDELVFGQNIDTNSAYLSQYLASRGIGTLYHQSVADDQAAIVLAIDEASRRVELVIITGGIGPTDDDLTRQSLAQAMGVELIEDPASVAAIEARYKNLNRTMPPRNRVQALHPQGSRTIPNPWGTAPGIHAKLHQADIYVMPGVPSEMMAIFEASIAPQIDKLSGDRQVILTHKINTYGLGESTVAQKLGSLMDRTRNPKVGTTVSHAIVSVRIRAEFDTHEEAKAQLADTIAQVNAALGPAVFGDNDDTLWHNVVKLLNEQKLTLATAESCTAGLIAKLITDVPGSSEVFLGGWVTYTNGMKMSELNVSKETLDRHSAVSEPVALQMAQGALEKAGSDLAISVTGLAGPTGGTPEAPVGTVWIGLAHRKAMSNQHSSTTAVARCFHITGSRDDVRDRAAKSALQMLRYTLLGLDLENLMWMKAQAKANGI
jgi:nicotinamide-nucleotide amidase